MRGITAETIINRATYENKEVTILGIYFDKNGSHEADREKLVNVFNETVRMLKSRLRNIGKIQELSGCGNWLLLLSRLAMPVLQIFYELAGSRKQYQNANKEARVEFQ